MIKKRAVAVRQRTLVVNLRGKMKTRNTGEKMKRRRMRTDESEVGKQVAAEVKAVRIGPEKCGMRKRSSGVAMTAMTMNPRTLAEAAGRRAVEARMKEGTEETAGVAVPLQHAVITAVTTQRGLRVAVEVREAQTPVMPVTVTKISGPDRRIMAAHLFWMFSSKHCSVTLSLTPDPDISSVWGCSVSMVGNIPLKMLIVFVTGMSLFNPIFISRFNLRSSSCLYTITLLLSLTYLVQDHAKISLFSLLSTCHCVMALKHNKMQVTFCRKQSGQRLFFCAF